MDKGATVIERSSWIKVMFSLAKKFPKEIITVYVYSLGQMNKKQLGLFK